MASYCDVIDAGVRGLHFMVGDVSGKGGAASMLMAHLRATFRALIQAGIELKCLLEHASRVFAESTLPNQYASSLCTNIAAKARQICSMQYATTSLPFVSTAEDG
jgi:phosphoserine phosphatase RsbU/P